MVISGFMFVFRAHTRRDPPARQGAAGPRSGSVALQIRIWTTGERAVSHGVAREVSPRRQPWGRCALAESPVSGRQSRGPGGPSSAASRLLCSAPQPTADAVGHLLVAAPQLFAAARKMRERPGRADERRAALAILWLPAGQEELVFGL